MNSPSRIHVRAENGRLARTFERSLVAWPATVGRGAGAMLRLEGDDSVSAIHASLDLREGKVLVRDVRSTNGTWSHGKRLKPDQWTELGPATEEHVLTIGGWRILLRVAQTPHLDAAGARSLAPGATEVAPLLGDTMATVAGLNERVRALRDAQAALDRAVADCIEAAPAERRASLAWTLQAQYPELRPRAAFEGSAGDGPSEERGRTALAVLRDLAASAGVEVALHSSEDVRRFGGDLQRGVEAFARGLSRALAGVQTYREEVLDQREASCPTPRDLAKMALMEGDAGPAAIRRLCHDVAVHQLASFQAVVVGVRDLLSELSPEAIEQAVAERRAHAGLWANLCTRRARASLEEYRRRHGDLAGEESARFRVLFGSRFAEAYRQTIRETKVATQLEAAVLVERPAANGSRARSGAAVHTQVMQPALRTPAVRQGGRS